MAAVESFIIVHNVAKRHNVGTLVRSATAFGVSELILVGRRDFNTFGSHGSVPHVRFRHFYSLSDARLYLKVRPLYSSFFSSHTSFLVFLLSSTRFLQIFERGCDICGIEIVDGATAVHEHPFKRSTAFILGNEGTGLSSKECEICDFFVYIPQYGCGTASLNVTIAASIVLHHFGVWAGFHERDRYGGKYIVAEKQMKQQRRNHFIESENSVVEERERRKESFDFFGNGNGTCEVDDSHSGMLNVLFQM
ncbi:hypothetical protein EJ110_NYTH46837 [Nymphaea thermarum]|nr:hypothetical protein EJ110_NYTH46837 [Nymphaea thermarum]